MDDGTMRRSKIRPSWVVLAALGVLGLLAVGIPLATLLYVGVLLLCPLLMAGMHGGHGRHDASVQSHDRSTASDDADRAGMDSERAGHDGH